MRVIFSLCFGTIFFIVTTAQSSELSKIPSLIQKGDFNSAMRIAKPMASDGVADAQYVMGVAFESLQKPEVAFKWYSEAAKQGQSSAQYYLGALLGTGRAGKVDFIGAFKWTSLALKNPGSLTDNNGNVIKFGLSEKQKTMGELFANAMKKRLSSTDLTKAQELINACVSGNFKNC
jgi:TPR repeat protein